MLCHQLMVLLLLTLTVGSHASRAQSSRSDADDHTKTFYETHQSPMGWRTALSAANGQFASNSAAAQTHAGGVGKWKSQLLDPSTYNPKDVAAEKAFLTPKRHITVKRPAGSWNTSKSKAARAYKNMRLRYRNTMYNQERPGPAKYHMPGTVKELVQTIKRLNKKGVRWVARGGGHNYETTALPSGTKAAVIDMARFMQFNIASDGKSAVIGAGQRLGEVYLRLAQHNPPLLMVAGTCASNGASGYLLGGGFSVSSRKYGWATDQVRANNHNLRIKSRLLALTNPHPHSLSKH